MQARKLVYVTECNWKKLCANNMYHFALHSGPSEIHTEVVRKAASRYQRYISLYNIISLTVNVL